MAARDFKLKLSGFVELSAFAKKVCPERFQRNGKSQRASLNLLAQVMLGINLNKSDELRLCNWEASRLRQEQIDYAAIDAIVGLEVFNSLNKLAEDRNILVEKESYIPRDEEVPEDEGYKN
ncbi:Exonuclease 3'-5' domain-containing protein 2 [Physocladia obscura]|uniref:3'-5' exonuclease n=1 Tax=Physocladia obscura TaxID=109957 RepID=A0AAD5SQE5_9FUNG|nr:Exonuclease 3'-5' domain-containing protein 2 [Physocladia obscura]